MDKNTIQSKVLVEDSIGDATLNRREFLIGAAAVTVSAMVTGLPLKASGSPPPTQTLFEPTKLSSMKLKNRFFRAATWEELADSKGHLTEPLIKMYEDLAKGGVGTIITGFTNVTGLEQPQPLPNMMGIYEDSFIDEYKKLTNRVHGYGANIVMQIVHGGSNCSFNVDGKTTWAPSAVVHPTAKTRPKEMSQTDIKEIVQAFANAAGRVKKAGFDGVELHVAHGMLLNQFLSPYYNRRTDEYGGSIDNRGRMLVETYRAVRQAVGANYPVLMKIACNDFMDDGLTAEDSQYICRLLAEMGIDAIEISGGSSSSRKDEGPVRTDINTSAKEAYFKDYAAQVAEQVKVPVILVGGNRSLSTTEAILSSTKIEYFSLARPLLSEVNLIKRWQNGDTRKSRCISCNECLGVVGKICIFNR